MPHLFTNRPRQHNLLSQKPAGAQHFKGESINAFLYLVGSIIFILGSVKFLPGKTENINIGAWSFFVGSLIYLFVTVHDLLEAIAFHKSNKNPSIWKRLELISAIIYIIGSLLFTIGSLFFLNKINKSEAGSWCFIVGSILFIIGAAINVSQIILAGSLITLQLQNVTAICYILGSTIFLLATIPYLWQHLSIKDTPIIFKYTSWEFITGSFLFLAGGLFNLFRAYFAMKYYKERDSIKL